VLQVGTQQRSEYDDRFLRAVVLARSGRLGKKLHAISSVGESRWDSLGPFAPEQPPADLDWDFWQGQTPAVDFTPNRIGWDFRWWLAYSGGQVTDWGVHHTDIAIWALEGEKTGAVEADGKGEFPGLPGDVNVVDFLNGEVKIPATFNVAQSFDVNMKLPNGNTIDLVSKENELIISGELGRIRVNRGGLTGKPIEEIEKSPADKEWLEQEVTRLYGGPRHGHMANFFACVKDRKKPISDVWTHTRSVNSCHMANISMLLKRKVQFDPVKYEFVADDQANQLVNRHEREPYTIRV
jgi:myo-inositol 2-dehydrogenase/D-chiro-inositol 1-dehydrogenase